LLLGEAAGFLVSVVSRPPRPEALTFAKLGALLFYTFNHVGVTAELSRLAAIPGTPGSLPGPVVAGLSITPMAGTFMVALVMALSCGRAANTNEVTGVRRVALGVKAGVGYAAVCGVAALALRVDVATAQGSGTLRPDRVQAFVWPLIIGTAAGIIRALGRGLRDDSRSLGSPRWEWQARALVVGGGRLVLLALGLSLVALAALAPFSPRATRAYFEPFSHRPVDGVVRMAFTTLVLPNVSFWALTPSEGGCLGFSLAPVGGGSLRGCLVSYTQFPPAGGVAGIAAAAPGMDLPPPPAGYLGFLLAPLIAVIGGGWMAARRAVARGGRGAEAGALAGVGFGLWSAVAAALSSVGVSILGTAADRTELAIRIGPEVLVTALVALAWGVIGGAVGGAALSRRARKSSPTSPALGGVAER